MAYNTSGFAAVRDAIADKSSGKKFGKAIHPAYAAQVASWKEEAVKYVQFLSNAPMVFPFHTWVPGVKAFNGQVTRTNRDYVCTNALEGELKRPCPICTGYYVTKKRKDGGEYQVLDQPKPTVVTLGVLVDAKGKALTREVEVLTDPSDPDSESRTVSAPHFMIFNGGRNFWAPLDGYFSDPEIDSLTDRVYKITRSMPGGDKTKTVFTPLPKPPHGKTEEELWDEYDLPASDDYADRTHPVVIEWVERRGTEAYYKPFLNYLNGGVEDAESDGDASEESETVQSASADSKPSRGNSGGFKSLRDRVAQGAESGSLHERVLKDYGISDED